MNSYKRYCLIVCFLFLSSLVNGQSRLLPVFKSGKWALLNENLQLVTDYQFDDVQVFNDIGFKARKNELYALFDFTGKQITPFEFDDIQSDSLKLLLPIKNKRYGLMDAAGKILVTCDFDSMRILKPGFIILKISGGLWNYFSLANQKLLGSFENISPLGGQCYLFEKWGTKILYIERLDKYSSAYKQIEKKRDGLFFCTDFKDQLFVLNTDDNFEPVKTTRFYYKELKNNVYAFASYDGLKVSGLGKAVNVTFDATDIYSVTNYSNSGLASFLNSSYYILEKDGKKGLLNEEFKVILNREFDYIDFYNSDIVVLKNGKRGLYSNDGKILLSPLYEEFTQLEDYWIVNNNKKFGVLDKNGNVLIKLQYDNILPAFKNKFVITLNKLKGLVDENNKILIPAEYESVTCDTLACILMKNKKYGLAQPSGNILLNVKYDGVWKLNRQYYAFKENGKIGIISTGGLMVSKAKYSEVFSTGHDNIFMVSDKIMSPATLSEIKSRYKLDIDIPEADTPLKWHQTGLINCFGEILLETEYHPEQISADYSDNTFIVKEAESAIVISFDRNGKLIEKTKYNNYISVKKSKTPVSRNYWKKEADGDLWGLFSASGNKLIGFQFQNYWRNYLNNPDLVLTKGETNGIGIVDERLAKIKLAASYKYIFTNDFKVAKLARCVKSSGATALIDTLANVAESGIAYIDDFSRNYTRVNKGGKLKNSSISAYRLPKSDPDNINFQYFDFEKQGFKICEGGKWGILDKDGYWLMQPKYQFLQLFHRGVFIAEKDRKWGVVTPNDQIIIDFKFDEIRFLVDTAKNNWADLPYYLVRLNEKWGMIDSLGNLLIPCEYSDIQYFKIKDALYFKTISQTKELLFGLIDKQANVVLPPLYSSIGSFYEGLALCEKSFNCFSYIDEQLKLLSSDCFVEARDFHEGLAAVKSRKGWGFIDASGKMAIPAEYPEVGNFSEGLAPVKIKHKDKIFGLIKGKQLYVLMDKTGKVVLNTKSKSCTDVSDGQIIVGKGRKLKLITASGKKLLSGNFLKMIEYDEYGLLKLQNSKRQWALYNTKGECLIPFGKYQNYADFSEGLCFVEANQKGFIDTLGNLRFKIDCQKAGNFSCGLAKAMIKGKWGFINTSGKFVIPPVYAEVQDFENNLAKVKDDQFIWFQVDQSGRKQKQIYKADANGNRIYTKNGLKGMFDQNGNTIVNPLAMELGFFGEKNATFGVKKRYGLFDQKGNRLAEDSFLNIMVEQGEFIKLENLAEIRYIK